MIHDLYQNLPLNIDPTAFTVGSFSVKWYSISYIIGFLVVYGILIFRLNYDIKKAGQISNFQFPISNKFSNSKSNSIIKNSNLKIDSKFKIQNSELITDFLMLAFAAAVIGGRLGYVFLYNLPYFMKHPLEIFWPFQNGEFVGFYGMSFFGALIGVILIAWFFCKKRKISFLSFADFVVVAVPAGYFFGRIGNFLNGELVGRLTNSPLGMFFASDPTHLRHPSQLYEAMLEGLFLFSILWILKNRKKFEGQLFFGYVIGYACVRFVVEFFREIDAYSEYYFVILSLNQMYMMILLVISIVFWVRLSFVRR